MINTETINKLIVSGYDKLESVGCYLDSDVGSVYRIYIENGEEKCDYNLEISLYEDEVSLDWINHFQMVIMKNVNFGYLK